MRKQALARVGDATTLFSLWNKYTISLSYTKYQKNPILILELQSIALHLALPYSQFLRQ
jgi:hypothetical protein